MTFLRCPICRDEWIITTSICENCDRIRHYMEIYSRDKILEILDSALVVQVHKDKESTKPKTKIYGDDSKDYYSPKIKLDKK